MKPVKTTFFSRIRSRMQSLLAGEQRGYEGAAQSRRMRNFRPTYADLNTLLSAEGDELRARCRHLFRSNAWAANAREAFASNAVGTGIKPQSKFPEDKRREELHRWWLEWTDYCDAAGVTDLYGLQKMICDASFEAGESFVRLRTRRDTDRFPIPLQLQLLESEMCPLTLNQTGNEQPNLIRCGVEFNRLGQRVAYHLYREHPGSDAPRILAENMTVVPAESVLHQFKPKRPGQVRGEPWLAPSLVPLYEFDAYSDAEVVRKKTASMISHFIRITNPLDVPTVGTDETSLYEDNPVTNVVPGSVVYLKDNEDISLSQAADVGPHFSEFVQAMLYQIAAGLGVTYEMLTGDLRNVNYSSIRAGQLEIRRRIEQYQFQVLVYQFCRPVWQAFVEHCVMAGRIDARDYRKRKAEYLDVDWRTPAWQWVDPLKDVQAKILEVNNRFTSRDAVIHEMGDDPAVVDEQIEEGVKRSGFEVPSSQPQPAGNTGGTGNAPPGKQKPQPQKNNLVQ